ncbi:hypothetical protein [Synechococcus sp. CS-1331]|uniref:hypothetical protein n=1 Tax=Synechococcus sp. CS-1331 TaxID=2847973 RepID=UPI00223B40D8|nr:hypothetical protein [Synechococcus sp. CS-1331]
MPNSFGLRPRPGGFWYGVPLLLGLLALLDLRVELQLLADHFTFAALGAAVRSHLLAVAVLLLLPSLIVHYRSSQG